MRSFLITVFALFVNMAIAQDQGAVTGIVIEKSTGLPMEYVNVGLFRSDSSLYVSANTDKAGKFSFAGLKAGSYYIKASFIGFKTMSLELFSLAGTQALDLGKLLIEGNEKLLGEVDVVEEKLVFENGIDRKIYNVEKDVSSQSGSASDVMANIPSVNVDVDGNISLLGSGNVVILVNGKPSPLMRTNAATALQQIPANTIERIEIITNPSAKYKPDGAAGIINIVLKKNTKPGFNGTLTANAGNDERFNTGVTFSYKPGKLNLYGSYNFRYDYRSRSRTDYRTVFDSLGNEEYDQDLVSTASWRPVTHMATFGLDWSPDTLNEFGISGNYEYFSMGRDDQTRTTVYDPFETVTSDYLRNTDNNEYEWEIALESYWTHKFKKPERELNVELTGADHLEVEDNEITTLNLVPLYPTMLDHTRIQQREKQFELLAEYVSPLGEDRELEAGYYLEYLGQDFDFLTENFSDSSDSWLRDNNKSNRFIFSQTVHALYGTYSFDIEDLGVMIGLRAEQAFINSELVTLDSIVPNDYFKLYPTLHLSWEFEDDQALQLSYSRRVNRPEGDELNPFPEYTDPRNIEAGNPLLMPEQVHSIQAGYSLKNKKITFVPTLFYKYTYDAFTEVSRYINDTVLLTSFGNLANDQSMGLELIFSTKIRKFMNINLSGNGYYNRIDASNLGYSNDRAIFSWDSKLALNITPWKRGMIQLNASYRSERLTPQGTQLPSFGLNAGFRQDIFKERASLVLNCSDVLGTMRWATEIDTPELKQVVTSKRKSQILYVGFSWRFGKSLKKQEEEMKFDEKL